MRSRMRRFLEAVVGTIGLLLALSWLSGGCEEQTPPGRVSLPELETSGAGERVRVEELVEEALEWASGEVASARDTVVSSRVMARIEAIRATAGSRVEEGDVLVVLDARDLKAGVGEADEALRSAQASLELARSEAARVRALFESGVASQRQLDQVTSELRAAEASVGRLTEAREQSRAQLSFAEIRAPVSGRVVDRLAEPGDTATPGTPLLRIYDPTLLRVEVPVRESLAVHLRVGQSLGVEIPSMNEHSEGVIDEIVPLADPGARTLLVKVRLRKEDERLLAGLYARVAIPAGQRRRLLVPSGAVQEIGQLSYVEVVTEADGRERRLVTTGRQEPDDRIEILSGLEPAKSVWVPRPPTAGARAPRAPARRGLALGPARRQNDRNSRRTPMTPSWDVGSSS
jgi:membrane fusion protein (multidrug efflux system)